MDGNNTVVATVSMLCAQRESIVVVFLLYRDFSAWCTRTRAMVVPFGRVELNKIRGHPHESNTLPRQHRGSSIIVVEEDGEIPCESCFANSNPPTGAAIYLGVYLYTEIQTDGHSLD